MPALTTPVAVVEGERWGGFVFTDNPQNLNVTVTPPPIDLGEFSPFDYPGFRKFETVEDLLRFINGRIMVAVPQSLPAGASLIGAWAIETPDQKIADAVLAYTLTGSVPQLGDPDLMVAVSYRVPRPFVYPVKEVVQALGQRRETPQRVSVAGHDGVFLPYDNPPGIGQNVTFASALSWFEDDGAFRSIQGKNLDFAMLSAIAASFE